MLPSLSRQIGAGDTAAANRSQNRAIELVLVLTLPATAALMVAAVPLIRALLQHGVFGNTDTIASAEALAAFSLGLPAYVLIKVLVPGFLARQDTRTPAQIALVAMLANLFLNLILIWPLRHIGLALSTALSAWVNAGLLYWMLHKRGHFTTDARLRRTAVKLALATLAMGILLFFAAPIVDRHVAHGLIERILWLGGLMAAGAGLYFGTAIALGAFRLAELRARLSRRRR
jgi:putative peptidoglycan lipid II flippase